jgi:hypothetical protein
VCDGRSGVDLAPTTVRGLDGCFGSYGNHAIVAWEEEGRRWQAESSTLTTDELIAELATWVFLAAQHR